jgi:hypothetical protein
VTWGQRWTPPAKLRDLPPPPAAAVRPAVRGSYAANDSHVAVPKGEKARTGKRAPTAAEREWMDAIVRYGCIACRMDGLGVRPAAVHHILRGGRRMGHLFTLPLCDPGHHQNGQGAGLVSRHPWKARFEQRYGSEDELLARLRAEIGERT